jgi:hypothetical protein
LPNFKNKLMASKTRLDNPQAGVTLIVAVMVLSIVSILSFSLGALVLREIKVSRQMAKSEPAIVAAEAGAETALFYRIRNLRGVGPSEMFVGCSDINPGTTGTIGSSSFEFCSKYYDNPYIFGTHGTHLEVVVLYNPENPTNPAAGYTSIYITATSSSPTTNILRADAWDLSTATVTASTLIAVGSGGSLSGLSANTSYGVFLYPCNTPPLPATHVVCNADTRVSGSITVNAGGGPTAGIPAKYPRILSKGVRDNLIRQLEVKLYGGP